MPKHCVEETPQTCEVGHWTEWTKTVNGQIYRQRAMTLVPMKGTQTKDPCKVALRETAPGANETADCVMSEWVEWDSCDVTCGAGQRQRHRQVHTLPSKGGKDCPPNIVELEACYMKNCNAKDCVMGVWSSWSACKGTCDAGQQKRSRDILKFGASGAAGCANATVEFQGCALKKKCGDTDCEWGEWHEWSQCSCSCGGGTQQRSRHIKVHPIGAGKLCEARTMLEVGSCNTQRCGECEDGKWSPWSEWSACSSSCSDGLTYRIRMVHMMASDCGKPAEGLSHEYERCNKNVSCSKDVDCQWGHWGSWHGCSASCDGVMSRSREIAVQGVGNGKFCTGSGDEVANCNPSAGETRPPLCRTPKKLKCDHGAWSSWSECSVTCGTGQRLRNRTQTGPADLCHGATAEVGICSMKACFSRPKQDCKWGSWSEWGACTKCSGQRFRHRHITESAFNGGKSCDAGDLLETEACPRHCREPAYCSWSSWSEWGSCSAHCGQGTRTRSRTLAITSVPPVEDVVQKNDLLRERAKLAQNKTMQSLVVAFLCGAASLAVAFGVAHVFLRRERSHRMEAEGLIVE